ncbi:MAG: hypothetical protein GWP15_03365, partial [Nitrospirae bacterium]|nr:hypothetical protein [Nitrospirota bacterium]
MIKSKIRGEEGFIMSIVAFGIFVLMASFAISVQQTVINSTNRIKTINNNVKAEDISDTTTRYL